MANKRISDLTPKTTNLSGTEELEINDGGVSLSTTVTKLSTAANTFINTLKGDVELEVNDCTLTVGNDTDGYTTLVHSSLIGLVSLRMVLQNGAYIKRANITYTSSIGRIVLGGGEKFRKDCILFITYKKA